jgi:hypothetical protein
MKMFIILDMKKNKIDNFSLKIILLTSIDHIRSIDRDWFSFCYQWITKENHFSTSLEYKLISKLRRHYAFEARLNKCIQEYQLQIIYHFSLNRDSDNYFWQICALGKCQSRRNNQNAWECLFVRNSYPSPCGWIHR